MRCTVPIEQIASTVNGTAWSCYTVEPKQDTAFLCDSVEHVDNCMGSYTVHVEAAAVANAAARRHVAP